MKSKDKEIEEILKDFQNVMHRIIYKKIKQERQNFAEKLINIINTTTGKSDSDLLKKIMKELDKLIMECREAKIKEYEK